MEGRAKVFFRESISGRGSYYLPGCVSLEFRRIYDEALHQEIHLDLLKVCDRPSEGSVEGRKGSLLLGDVGEDLFFF